MQAVESARPKALFEVAGQPFIAHQLRRLRRGGGRRLVLCIGHPGDQIEAYVGDGRRFGMQVEYSRERRQLLGTAGALRHAAPLLGPVFWVTYGDTYLDVDLGSALAAFRSAGTRGLMTVFHNDNRWDTSNVVYRDGRIVDYDKRAPRPDMPHIDYGLGLLTKEPLDLVPADTRHDLADLYRDLLARSALAGFEVHQRFYEIGSPEGLRETRSFLEEQPS